MQQNRTPDQPGEDIQPTRATEEQADWYARGMLDERANTQEALEVLTEGFQTLPPVVLEYLGTKGYRFFPLSKNQLDYLPVGAAGRTKKLRKVVYLAGGNPGTAAHEAIHAWTHSYHLDLARHIFSPSKIGHLIDQPLIFNSEFLKTAKNLTVYASTSNEEAKAEAGRIYFGARSFSDPEYLLENGKDYDLRSYGNQIAPDLATPFTRLLENTEILLNSKGDERPWRWDAGKSLPPRNKKSSLSLTYSRIRHVFPLNCNQRANGSNSQPQPLAAVKDIRELVSTKILEKIPPPPDHLDKHIRVFEKGKWSFRSNSFSRGSVQLLHVPESDPKKNLEYFTLGKMRRNKNGQATRQGEGTTYVAEDLYRFGCSRKKLERITDAVKNRIDSGLPVPEYVFRVSRTDIALSKWIDPLRSRRVGGRGFRDSADAVDPSTSSAPPSGAIPMQPDEPGSSYTQPSASIPMQRDEPGLPYLQPRASILMQREQKLSSAPMQRAGIPMQRSMPLSINDRPNSSASVNSDRTRSSIQSPDSSIEGNGGTAYASDPKTGRPSQQPLMIPGPKREVRFGSKQLNYYSPADPTANPSASSSRRQAPAKSALKPGSIQLQHTLDIARMQVEAFPQDASKTTSRSGSRNG